MTLASGAKIATQEGTSLGVYTESAFSQDKSADSDPSHKVRPVTHFPNIRVCTTKEELAGATRLASPSTVPPPLHPSHMPTLSHPPGHIPCVRVFARLEVSF